MTDHVHPTPKSPASRNPFRRWPVWPVGIISYYLFFVCLCFIFAFMARKVRFDLVADDYYDRGVAHDERMAALARTRALPDPPRMEIDEAEHRLIVYMPMEARDAVLTMYRPADAREDRRYALRDIVPSVIAYESIPHGRWQAQIEWHHEGHRHYFEKDVFLPW
ncbi:MAG: FixH family protein [Verrucomicrobia bacterium]|nr:FixH family protein [Verrucomicrobiota bacterium]MCH8514029.1 FixH family protein [Kiritimatiellia bacterium]